MPAKRKTEVVLGKYAASGHASALSCVVDWVSKVTEARGTIDALPGDIVEPVMRRLIKAVLEDKRTTDVLECICFLVNPRRHKGARKIFSTSQGYPASECLGLIAHIGRNLTFTDYSPELSSYLFVLREFLAAGPAHQLVVVQDAALLKSLIVYMQAYFTIHSPQQILALQVLAGLLRCDVSAREGLPNEHLFGYWRFVEMGGLRTIFSRALDSVDSCGSVHIVADGLRPMFVAIDAAIAPLFALTQVKAHKFTGVDKILYTLSMDDIVRLTTTLYDYLDQSMYCADLSHEELQELVKNIQVCGMYLDDFLGDSTKLRFLAYKPLDSAAEPIALLLLRLARDCGEVFLELSTERLIAELTSASAELRDILAAARFPARKVRIVKDRHCAYPGCTITGKEGCYNNMKKCARCRVVYYCSRSHQRQHWFDEHRQLCGRKRYKVFKDRSCAFPGCPVTGNRYVDETKWCGRCCAVFYCGRDHQEQHWRMAHRLVCVPVSSAQPAAAVG